MRSESRRNRACISAGSAAISAATVSFRISTRQAIAVYISILRSTEVAQKAFSVMTSIRRAELTRLSRRQSAVRNRALPWEIFPLKVKEEVEIRAA